LCEQHHGGSSCYYPDHRADHWLFPYYFDNNTGNALNILAVQLFAPAELVIDY
jgi:hypothetical protein